jgi:hypothetical protein
MRALADFMQHFGIAPNEPPRRLLENVVTAFARLPYENITNPSVFGSARAHFIER